MWLQENLERSPAAEGTAEPPESQATGHVCNCPLVAAGIWHSLPVTLSCSIPLLMRLGRGSDLLLLRVKVFLVGNVGLSLGHHGLNSASVTQAAQCRAPVF